MPTIRQRVANYFLGDERARLQNAIESLAEVRQWVRSPAAIAENLSEVDTQLIDLMIQQAGYIRIGGTMGGYGALEQIFNESMRQRQVVDSRWLYHMDVLVSAAVDMWTDFGFGQHVGVTPTDPTLAEVFKEFWEARRNQSVLGDENIHENSNRVITDGELFFAVWASTLDGVCTIRRIDTDRMTDIICDPDDPATPLWYIERSARGDLYYADWRATPEQLDRGRMVGPEDSQKRLLPDGARFADDVRQNTRVVIVPVQRNKIGKRGWPQMRQAMAWARAYKDFIGDRATIAKRAAQYVEKITAKGSGQRQIDNIVNRLQSSLVNSGERADTNQNITAGQTWVQNEQINREWMARDTGASGAQIDGITIAGQFAAGARVPLHWLGRADAMQNRAVAKESTLPWYKQIQRYQTFTISIFSSLVEVVGRFANEYKPSEAARPTITDYACQVSLDSPFQNDIDEINTIMGAIGAAAQAGNVDSDIAKRALEALIRLALQSLGIQEVESILADDGAEDGDGDETDPDGNGLPDDESNNAEYAEALRLAESVNEVLREYDNVLTRWGADTLNGRMSKIDYRRAHKAALNDFGKRAYEEALKEGGADPKETTADDAERLNDWIDDQKSFVNAYADWLVSEDGDGKRNTESKRAEMADRIDLWTGALRNLAQIAEASAQGDPMLEYAGEDGEESCEDCQEWLGQVHRLSFWEKRGLTKRNGNKEFECGRWEGKCHHGFVNPKTREVVIA